MTLKTNKQTNKLILISQRSGVLKSDNFPQCIVYFAMPIGLIVKVLLSYVNARYECENLTSAVWILSREAKNINCQMYLVNQLCLSSVQSIFLKLYFDKIFLIQI